jgi:hypothetical protein
MLLWCWWMNAFEGALLVRDVATGMTVLLDATAASDYFLATD